MRSFLAILPLAAVLATPVAALPVDLELVLAVDVSGSIDDHEAELQRQGYIAAFGHRRVVEAIGHGYHGRIAVMYFEWAGFGHNRIIADWTAIANAADAGAFQEVLRREPPRTARRTSISQAIEFASSRFADNGFEGKRRVIDISGDGANNWGNLVHMARDTAVAAGITINGLPIINDRPSRFGRPPMRNLDLYYQDCVIGGRSAFIVVAEGFADFAKAVLRKLILEIADTGRPVVLPSAVRPATFHAPPPCDTGERRWQRQDDF